MPLLPINPRLLKGIKILSCLLIAGALGLVAVKASGLIPQKSPLDKAFWLGSVALVFHGLEAMVAAVLAHRLNENVIKAALYTFWTGAAGLAELFQQLDANSQTTV